MEKMKKQFKRQKAKKYSLTGQQILTKEIRNFINLIQFIVKNSDLCYYISEEKVLL